MASSPDEIRVTKTTTTTPYVDPPLLTITNPVNYLRRWWKRVISREGIDFRLRIHPVTAFVIIVMVGSASFGAGRISVPSAITQLIPQWIIKPTPTPDPWRETAYAGILQKNSSGKFYLVTQGVAEAVALEVPSVLNLDPSVGKRVFATGKLNTETGVLVISDAAQIQVILQTAPIIRRSPPASPRASPSPSLLPTESASPSPAL
jgi:hypothetical protein